MLPLVEILRIASEGNGIPIDWILIYSEWNERTVKFRKRIDKIKVWKLNKKGWLDGNVQLELCFIFPFLYEYLWVKVTDGCNYIKIQDREVKSWEEWYWIGEKILKGYKKLYLIQEY